MTANIAVFASGGGTNFQALLDHFSGVAAGVARVALVVSDRADAGALARAREAGIETRVVPVTAREAGDVAREMLAALESAAIDLVALAGYTRLVPAAVVQAFRGRMVNIHPSLLPAFGGRGMYGARVHRAVIEAGCRVSGATVHFVDERYDTGPILFQWPVPVRPEDTPEVLAARVLRVEHRIYPVAVEALARAVMGGTALRPWSGLGEAAAFSVIEAEAPALEEIRRILGL
ncbi:MAG TPA: phosphoribosylglycinamide formyltransferase [Longimicrobiales bacterium]